MHKLQLDRILHWNCSWKKCDDVSGFQEEHSTHIGMLPHKIHFAHKNIFTYLKEKRIENNWSDEQYSQSNTMCFPLYFKLCSFSKLYYRINGKLFFIFYSEATQYFLQFMQQCSIKSFLKVILIWSQVGWRQKFLGFVFQIFWFPRVILYRNLETVVDYSIQALLLCVSTAHTGVLIFILFKC